MAPSRLRRWIPHRSGRKDDAGGSSKETHELKPQGIKVVAEGNEPIIDIVAVHGLNGHREKTWTAGNDVHWLRDLLPNDIPNARILCWGYDANTHGNRVSGNYLYDHARSLVSDLCLKRKLTNTMQRPIIFVAHSLGGIIVKSALIHSDAARKGALEEHRSIKMSTYGIMFMGTPHQGGSGVSLGKLLVNVASVFVAADDKLMKHLEQDSEWLQQQLGQYGPISRDFVTKFAYEEYKTPTALGHSIMVVPRESAVVPGAVDAEPIAIHADHINMVRFASKDNNGYMTVSGHLQVMVQSARDAIALLRGERNVDTSPIEAKEDFSIVFSLSEVFETNHFIARHEELEAMHKVLSDSTNRRAVTLHGLGGIGKTQLAIAYAKAYRDEYSAVFWLNIKDEVSVKRGYFRIAERILQEYPSASQLSAIQDDSPLDVVVEAVKRWLEHSKNTQWLLVLDNYDNPKIKGNVSPGAVDIQQFIPKVYHGSIIVTTRSSRVSVGQCMRVGKLEDVHDSLQILRDMSRRESTLNDPDAAELAEELDGLPLALATAGAYLNQVSTSFADYLRCYKESWLRLQKISPEVSSYEDRQLHSTWQLSLDHIMRQNKPSAMLLQLWAYFDNQDLWFELLREGRNKGPEWFCQVTEDELSFDDAMRVLCDYGLVEVSKSLIGGEVGRKGYGMHSCVHSWTIHVLNQEWDLGLANLALECVGRHIPVDYVQGYYMTQRRLLRHADRCWGFIIDGKLESDVKDWFLHYIGHMYSDQDRKDEAERVYQQALHGAEKQLGLEHEITLGIVDSLGILYWSLGRYNDAEKMYQRALQGLEKALGPEHTSTLDTVNNLGILYRTLGRLDEAEKMYQQALQGFEKKFGLEHSSVLHTVNNLGLACFSQGRFNEAEKLFQRALQGFKKIRRLDNFYIHCVTNNLGVLYTKLGRFDEAEKMLQQVLQGHEAAFGQGHSLTLNTVRNLGEVYKGLGRLDEAEKMYQRASMAQQGSWTWG